MKHHTTTHLGDVPPKSQAISLPQSWIILQPTLIATSLLLALSCPVLSMAQDNSNDSKPRIADISTVYDPSSNDATLTISGVNLCLVNKENKISPPIITIGDKTFTSSTFKTPSTCNVASTNDSLDKIEIKASNLKPVSGDFVVSVSKDTNGAFSSDKTDYYHFSVGDIWP